MPCRLAVFLARRAPVGAMLRRGPSAWAQLIHWDRSNDRVTPGQWFHGRVYERRCDLSPDGRLFIYIAAKHGAAGGIGEAWTAISQPPCFTGLALWPNLGSWHGGGVFLDDSTVALDSCAAEPHPAFRARKLQIDRIGATTAPWEQRLLRDGWQLLERGFDPRTHRRVGKREVWAKRHPTASLRLCREIEDVDFQRYGGPYHEIFWLETAGDLIPLEGATFADWDGKHRVVFVREGKLFQAGIEGDLTAREIFDPNPLRPQEVATPAWAQRW